MSEQISVTLVNHVAVDIAASPAAVWEAILDEYVEARKFREQGGSIEPLDDPAAYLGGYRMRIDGDGATDERVVHITELDRAARRLSLRADYVSVPGGMKVYATYQAQDLGGTSRYALDCHSRVNVSMPRGGKADLAALVEQRLAGSKAHLVAYLESIKARLETGV